MSGFVGYIEAEIRNNNNEIINKMLEKIKHRGDKSDVIANDLYALGQLAFNEEIVFYSDDKSKIIVFDGVIYNNGQLKEELFTNNDCFKTDAEIILKGYEKHKEGILNKLRGMFSFVIYDLNSNELFGARDFFGIKPFYYYIEDNNFMFSSEIKSFLEHPNFKKVFNEEFLECYFVFQFSPLDKTFFKNVYKLIPGHYFIYKDNQLEIKQYYKFSFQPNYEKTTLQWKEEVTNLLNNSLAMHLQGNEGIGSYLSSGVDSSYLVAKSKVLKTFTVDFNDDKYKESEYAKKLALDLNIKNNSILITKEEYFSELPKIMYYFDEPIGDVSAPCLYFLSKMVKNDVSIVLSGEGADEMFAGYGMYKEQFTMTKYDLLPYFVRYALGQVASIVPARRGINFLVRRGLKLEKRYISPSILFYSKEVNKLLKVRSNCLKYDEVLKPYYNDVKDLDDVSQMQYIDFNFWLVNNILFKSDKMNMANGVQVRVPFLDKDLIELVVQLPTDEKVDAFETKKIFRLIANDVLNEDIAYRQKLGFPVPLAKWLRDEDIYIMIKSRFLEDDIFFNQKYIIKLLDKHYSKKEDNMKKIWLIYSFLIWYDTYFKA